MLLHGDFQERVAIATDTLPWIAVPGAALERRLLERMGGEIARATSIVRYAPGCHFPRHTHGGGEEILVLAGIFQDDQGDYPAGTYLRNPVGSCHAPYSDQGCTLLVKLWQMDPEDQRRVVLDTHHAPWHPGFVEGLTVLSLHQYGGEQIALVRWAPGTHFPTHRHLGGEEIFVLEGVFQDDQGHYPAGTWLRNPPHSMHTPWSDAGCLIYVKVGHLPPQLPAEFTFC